MTPSDLRAGLLRLLAALEGRALAGFGPEARAGVAAAQVRLILAKLDTSGGNLCHPSFIAAVPDSRP
jgi:hypothetical protein